MRKIGFYLLIIIIAIGSIFIFRDTEFDLESVVKRGNVVYTADSFQEGHPHVPLLVSNGIVGACFDHMGFMSRPNSGMPEGRTHLGYIDNYDVMENSRQIQFPLAVLQARFSDGTELHLMQSEKYSQELDIYSGTLTTSYDLFGETAITSYAHQEIPNLFVMDISRISERSDKNLELSLICETSRFHNNDFGFKVDPLKLEYTFHDGSVDIVSESDLTTTEWTVSCQDATFTLDGDRIRISLPDGDHSLRFFIKRSDCPGIEVLRQSSAELLASHTATWNEFWQESWVDFPEDRAQWIWTRMKYYALSHFPKIPEKPMIPTGLNSNIWGFTFPQDVYYVAENLPRLGHFARSEAAMQYWLDVLPEVKEYSRRIMDVEGGFYPWTPPYQDWHLYEAEGVVGADSYELHNPAYVAAMVWHYFKYSQDTLFLRQYFPVIEEVFRFYSNISEPNDRGTYDIYHENARGQDEASTKEGDLRNLLCASYSAEYTTRNYLAAVNTIMAGDPDLIVQAEDILGKEYERDVLLNKNGYYATYEGDARPAGNQKHPVQLNPITYVPMADLVTSGSPTEVAWENRFDLTRSAYKPITLGWTIGQFALASCRMHDPEAFARDLSAIQPCRGADPRWIQFYESSFWEGWHLAKSYYFPMMGLYLQAFTDVVVQDWKGTVELFGCVLPDWRTSEFSFHGIRSLNGCVVSGKYDNGSGYVEIEVKADGVLPVSLAFPNSMLRIRSRNFSGKVASGEIAELKVEKGELIKLYF